MKRYLISWDFLLSLLAFLASFLAPSKLSDEELLKFIGLAVSVNAIVFAFLFAAVAIIASVSSEDFVIFLEEKGNVLSSLFFDFRAVSVVLFLSLLAMVSTTLMIPFGTKAYFVEVIPPSYLFFLKILWRAFISLQIATFVYGLASSLQFASELLVLLDRRVKFLEKKARIAKRNAFKLALKSHRRPPKV